MSEVTVPNEATTVTYTITTSDDGPFIVPFAFFEEDHVKVVKIDSSGVRTELTRTTEWSFTTLDTPVGQIGVGYDGGEITLVTALENHTLEIYRDTVIERLTNYPATGPFSITLLNNELAKHIAIMQELETSQNAGSISLDGSDWDANGSPIKNVGEGSGEAYAATVRQVDAGGPNFLGDDDNETAVGTYNQWNTIYTASSVEIQGNETTKLFDLMTEFYTQLQNRGGSEASFYIRLRYQVDCYTQITKTANVAYPIKVAATSAIPYHFMDIAQDIDYTNGDGTMTVAIDIYPIGSTSGQLYMQWRNCAVNTSSP